MPGNEFEKKVYSEMQELKLQPSEEVWNKVEKRIRKKDRKRGIIVIFFLLGLALLGYWQQDYLLGKKKTALVKTETSKENITEPQEKIAGNSASNYQNQEKIQEKIIADEKPEIKQLKTNLKTIPGYIPVINKKKEGKVVKNISELDQVKDKFQKTPDPEAMSSQQRKDSVSTINSRLNFKEEAERKKEADTDTALSVIKINEQLKEAPDKIKAVAASDSLPDSVALAVDLAKKLIDSAVSAVQRKPGSNKWKWGILFSPGISSINANSFSIGGTKSADYLSNPNTSGGTPNPSPALPSENKAGFALRLGLFIQKRVSLHSNFSLGLNYSFYTNHIRKGAGRDSLLNNFSQSSVLQDASRVYSVSGAASRFTNYYHLIELPVMFQWKLNKNKTKPLAVNFGFSAGWLVAVDALVYDTSFGGIYYKSKNPFNKTVFNLSTGLSWTFLTSNKIQCTIGPSIDLQLSRLLNSPLDKNKYLHFTGIQSTIIFSAKK